MYNLQEFISLFGMILTGHISASGKVPIPKTMELCTSLLDRLPGSGQLFLLLSVPMVLYLERKPIPFEVENIFIKMSSGPKVVL